MDHSNRNRTPAELKATADALRAARPQASPLELDRIKLQAIRQAERSRTGLYAKKGTFMKSRLALTVLLVAGFMLSTTGATLAVSGSSGSGSAASNQYVPSGTGNEGNSGGNHPEHHTKGAQENGGNEPSNTLEPAPEVEVAPAAAEQTAVVSSGSSLPFTGFVAIPLLVIGLGLIVGGAVLGIKSRKDPVARS